MDLEKVKIGLLGVMTISMVYMAFIKEDKKIYTRPTGEEVTSNVAATPANNQQNISPVNPITIDNTKPQQQQPKASETRPKTTIAFNTMKHDFGTIKQDSKNKFVFKFTNTGKEPLIIENALGSCGCTVPKYPKEPIKPGESGEIEVEYSPGKQEGLQTKTVTVTANTEPITTVLQINANVVKNE
ncbi:MAG: hypothetical protein Kow0079_02500 [Vicingaceae bacterium]